MKIWAGKVFGFSEKKKKTVQCTLLSPSAVKTKFFKTASQCLIIKHAKEKWVEISLEECFHSDTILRHFLTSLFSIHVESQENIKEQFFLLE